MLTFTKKGGGNETTSRSKKTSSFSNRNIPCSPNEEDSNDLWLQSHKPTSTKELAMHPSRVIPSIPRANSFLAAAMDDINHPLCYLITYPPLPYFSFKSQLLLVFFSQ